MQEAVQQISRMLDEGRLEDAIRHAEPILAAATDYGPLGAVRELATVLQHHCMLLAVRKQDREAMLLEDPLRRARALLGQDIYGNPV